MTKLTAGLKETLGRFLGRSEEVSVGVAMPPVSALSDLLELPFRADGGLRLDPCCLALAVTRWRLGVSSLQHLHVLLFALATGA